MYARSLGEPRQPLQQDARAKGPERSAGHCRFCGGHVVAFMTLGLQPVAQRFRAQDSVDDRWYELQPATCANCQLFQLIDTPDPATVFRADYPYASGLSTTMTTHLQQWARRLAAGVPQADPFVVEIGANDGTLLAPLAECGLRHLGIEPAAGVARVAHSRGLRMLEAFFDSDLAGRITVRHGRADLIVAANVIAHIPNIADTAAAIRTLLKPAGLFTFEAIYLGDVVANTAFDQLYDEHVFTLSVTAVQRVFGASGLELIDVQPVPIQGGSMRYLLMHRGRHQPSARVQEWIECEVQRGLHRPETFQAFAARCVQRRNALRRLLGELREAGSRVAGYGASAKSTTLLNYVGVGPDDVSFIADSTPAKQGMMAPGSGIPIRSPQYFEANYPTHALLLAWNHRAEIEEKLAEYRHRGGAWIVHVPDVAVI